MAHLVKKTALTAAIRLDLPEIERGLKFAAHSLRASLASSAEADELSMQTQLGPLPSS